MKKVGLFFVLVKVDDYGLAAHSELGYLAVGLDEEDDRVENGESSSGQEVASREDDPIIEPQEGMEFDSEDAARMFYSDYACSAGFLVRVMACHRSEKDGSIIARKFGCNKEGFSISERRELDVKNPRPRTREGCKAMIYVKLNKSGKWVITRFVKEHTHPLVPPPPEARQRWDVKDKRIQELTVELRNKKRLCAMYGEQLSAFMKIIEDHGEQLSQRVQNVVKNLKEFEPLDQAGLQHK